MTLTPSQGLHSLSQLGVDHRDVSIGNVLLGTDPDKAAGFISDLDLSSISEEAIKEACPKDYDAINKQMKDGEWRTVCDYYPEAAPTPFSYIHPCAQGTALFMSRQLLHSLDAMSNVSGFTFQHRLCHDFESLIWVVVYAMMIHRRNTLAPKDIEECEKYKRALDRCWAAHAYSNILIAHDHMMATGCSAYAQSTWSLWFPDLHEAAFFREAMHLIRDQDGGKPITYTRLCALFNDHIHPAKEPRAVDVAFR